MGTHPTQLFNGMSSGTDRHEHDSPTQNNNKQHCKFSVTLKLTKLWRVENGARMTQIELENKEPNEQQQCQQFIQVKDSSHYKPKHLCHNFQYEELSAVTCKHCNASNSGYRSIPYQI